MKEIITQNIYGFDKWIFLLAIVNFFVFLVLVIFIIPIRGKMKKVVYPYTPTAKYSIKKINAEISETNADEFERLRKRLSLPYSLFVNFIAIFPLMGILGTVWSLLGLVSDSSNITGNFYSALTSTFWGIVFAIIFKIFDAFISPTIEETEKISESLRKDVGEKAKK